MFLPKAEFIGLYIAYMFSCLRDRIWGFSSIFIIGDLGGLRLVTINQLFQGLTQMVLTSFVGNWYDRSGRWLGVQVCLLLNNLSIAISAVFLVVCLILSDESRGDSVIYVVSLISSIGLGAVSMAAGSGEKTAFTKDYIVVMVSSFYETESQDKTSQNPTTMDSMENKVTRHTNNLSKQNAVLTIIDQSSSIVSPIIGGLIVDNFGSKTTTYIMIAYVIMGWIGESLTLHWVYKRVPALAVKNKDETAINLQPEKLTAFGMVKVYFNQAVFPAALGLSLLYMNVLAFDGISISFGKKQGLDSTILGVFQAIGSALGVLAAVTYPIFAHRLGIRKSALLGLSTEFASLIICIISIFLPGSPFDLSGYFGSLNWNDWWHTFLDTFDATSDKNKDSGNSTGMNWSKFEVDNVSATSLFAMYCGITLARFGLWLSDLSISQLMQESVDESIRGTVFGVQAAFCQFFTITEDILAILLPDSKTFGLLAFVSVAAVGSALLLVFCFHIKQMRTKVFDNVHNKEKSIEEHSSFSITNEHF